MISAGGGRRRPDQGEPGEPGVPGAEPTETPDDTAAAATEAEPTALIQEVDPDLERLLAEEEEIERRTREHHEAPHFHKDVD